MNESHITHCGPWSCPNHASHMDLRSKVKSHISRCLTHTTDGPVTAFVIIARATELCLNVARVFPEYNLGDLDDLVANGLYEALTERDMLREGYVEVTGS